MKIRNVSPRTIHVAGLSIAPNRVGEVPSNHFRSWLASGSANRQTAEQHLSIESGAESIYEPPPPPEPDATFDQGPDEEPDGSATDEEPDGSATDEEPDGSATDEEPDGSATDETPDEDQASVPTREDRIREAILSLDRQDASLFTAQGLPKIEEVRARSGLDDVSALERDTVWATLNADQ